MYGRRRRVFYHFVASERRLPFFFGHENRRGSSLLPTQSLCRIWWWIVHVSSHHVVSKQWVVYLTLQYLSVVLRLVKLPYLYIFYFCHVISLISYYLLALLLYFTWPVADSVLYNFATSLLRVGSLMATCCLIAAEPRNLLRYRLFRIFLIQSMPTFRATMTDNLPVLVPIWCLEGVLLIVHVLATVIYEYALLMTRVRLTTNETY